MPAATRSIGLEVGCGVKAPCIQGLSMSLAVHAPGLASLVKPPLYPQGRQDAVEGGTTGLQQAAQGGLLFVTEARRAST